MKTRNHAGMTVVKFLGEHRIQDGSGNILGSGASDNAHFKNAERVLLEGEAPHKDSLGFVWSTKSSADLALATVAKRNLK